MNFHRCMTLPLLFTTLIPIGSLGQTPEKAPADRTHWSFRPIARPETPVTKFDSLARNPIDRFLFRKLEEKGLQPGPEADRLALLRRVTLDLTGLPPTLDEIDAFLNDNSRDAYEK